MHYMYIAAKRILQPNDVHPWNFVRIVVLLIMHVRLLIYSLAIVRTQLIKTDVWTWFLRN